MSGGVAVPDSLHEVVEVVQGGDVVVVGLEGYVWVDVPVREEREPQNETQYFVPQRKDTASKPSRIQPLKAQGYSL